LIPVALTAARLACHAVTSSASFVIWAVGVAQSLRIASVSVVPEWRPLVVE
jgi:hypothetical protein